MAGDKRAYKIVLEQILEQIHSGVFPAGGRLPPERELAERFKVSRPTIREAIIALETLDYVEVKVGSGVYVIENSRMTSGTYDNVSAFELTESRALIEGEAAALAAKMITDEELVELERSLDDMAMENEQGDLAAGDADKKFHQIIAQATRNAMMETIINQMWHVRNHAPLVFKAYQAICEQDGARRDDRSERASGGERASAPRTENAAEAGEGERRYKPAAKACASGCC